jgi:hypothetical protein
LFPESESLVDSDPAAYKRKTGKKWQHQKRFVSLKSEMITSALNKFSKSLNLAT